MARQQKNSPKPIDLALQGGGSHGAFTWGVLDALLEDSTFDFEGVSGTMMRAFGKELKGLQADALVAYLRTFAAPKKK